PTVHISALASQRLPRHSKPCLNSYDEPTMHGCTHCRISTGTSAPDCTSSGRQISPRWNAITLLEKLPGAGLSVVVVSIIAATHSWLSSSQTWPRASHGVSSSQPRSARGAQPLPSTIAAAPASTPPRTPNQPPRWLGCPARRSLPRCRIALVALPSLRTTSPGAADG